MRFRVFMACRRKIHIIISEISWSYVRCRDSPTSPRTSRDCAYFHISLKDKAKAWLHALPENTINTWDQMSKTFLSKYYPAQRTNAVRKEMMQFTQYNGESFHECWERYKNLYVQCPHHGFSDWQKVQHFYE